MKNLDTVLDREGVTRLVTDTEVTERVVVKPTGQGSRCYVAREDEQWTWRDLRDYVVAQMERYHGESERLVEFKEKAIFDSFLRRWGTQAAAVARYAFEVEEGLWMGNRVTILSFCKKSDPLFAEPIAERLT